MFPDQNIPLSHVPIYTMSFRNESDYMRQQAMVSQAPVLNWVSSLNYPSLVDSWLHLGPLLTAPVKPTEVLLSVRAWLWSQVLHISLGYFKSIMF